MNLGLLGAIGGFGQGMSTVGAGLQKQQDEKEREERSLIQSQKLFQFKEELDSAKRQRIAGEVTAEANAIASKRGADGLLSARQAVAAAGDSTELPEATAKGLDAAQAELSQPTTRDRIQARANLGYSDDLDLLKVDSSERQIKAAENANILGARKQDAVERRDEARNIREEALLALRERGQDTADRKVDAMIAGIGSWAKSSGASKAQTTSLIQNYAELERRGYPKEQIEKFLFEGKAPAESFTQSVEVDSPSGGKVKTTVKGGGPAPVPQDDPLGLRKSK